MMRTMSSLIYSCHSFRHFYLDIARLLIWINPAKRSIHYYNNEEKKQINKGLQIVHNDSCEAQFHKFAVKTESFRLTVLPVKMILQRRKKNKTLPKTQRDQPNSQSQPSSFVLTNTQHFTWFVQTWLKKKFKTLYAIQILTSSEECIKLSNCHSHQQKKKRKERKTISFGPELKQGLTQTSKSDALILKPKQRLYAKNQTMHFDTELKQTLHNSTVCAELCTTLQNTPSMVQQYILYSSSGRLRLVDMSISSAEDGRTLQTPGAIST